VVLAEKMFSTSDWKYTPDPDDLDLTGDANRASRPNSTYDTGALDSLPDYFDEDYEEGDLEAEREHEILLLKAYTDQLDDELKLTNAPEPSPSAPVVQNTPETPQNARTNQLPGIRSAPGELLIRTKKRIGSVSDDSGSDDSNDQNDDDEDRGIDDLKLGRRISPFASASKRRKLNEPKRQTDVFIVDDSDSSADERSPAQRRAAIAVSSSSESSDAEKHETSSKDVLFEATNALHAVHGHKTWEELPALYIPKELDFSKSASARKDVTQIDSESDDGLSMPNVINSRRSGAQQVRSFPRNREKIRVDVLFYFILAESILGR
jgi:hypothetical protein